MSQRCLNDLILVGKKKNVDEPPEEREAALFLGCSISSFFFLLFYFSAKKYIYTKKIIDSLSARSDQCLFLISSAELMSEYVNSIMRAIDQVITYMQIKPLELSLIVQAIDKTLMNKQVCGLYFKYVVVMQKYMNSTRVQTHHNSSRGRVKFAS